MKQRRGSWSLAVTLPLFMVAFCAILCSSNAYLGYLEFKDVFEERYNVLSSQLATIALSYVDGDSIERYAQNPVADDQWRRTNSALQNLTDVADLAYIYVTVTDPGYTRRTYIYDTMNYQIQNSSVIELGHVSSLEGRSAEYIDNIRQVMERGEPYNSYVYNKTGGHITTSIPVRNSEKRIVAMLSVVKPMSEVKAAQRQFFRSSLLSSALFSVAFVLIYIIVLINRVVNPLLVITQETEQFARHQAKLSGALGNISERNELGTLARSVEKMSVDMSHYIDELTRSTAEKERLAAELDVATQIQANMLPRIFPPYEGHPEIDLFATMCPAKEVGGDFYDFFMTDDTHFAVVVGDVSGKGVPAALFMVIAKTLIKNVAMQGLGPAQVFDRVNDLLCEGNDAGLFVTCWMGILCTDTGTMRFANAGHTPPVRLCGADCSLLVTKPGLMLAAMEGTRYAEHAVTLGHGDQLFLYTDGITEATNAQDELFGDERLLDSLKKTAGLSARQILDSVRHDVDAFVHDAPQFDDMTMLGFVYKPNNTGGTMRSRTFLATDENMTAVNEFVHACLPQPCSQKAVYELDVAVEEIYINIAHYAFGGGAPGSVEIDCDVRDGTMRLEFRDAGTQFNPFAREDPDITLSAEERGIGGLGIFLTKKFMDGYGYEYRDGKNVVTITKRLT